MKNMYRSRGAAEYGDTKRYSSQGKNSRLARARDILLSTAVSYGPSWIPRSIVLAVGLLAATPPSLAATLNWTGTTGDWSDAANWGGTVPGSADLARINKADAVVTLSNSTTIDRIRIDLGTVTIGSSAVLTITGASSNSVAGGNLVVDGTLSIATTDLQFAANGSGILSGSGTIALAAGKKVDFISSGTNHVIAPGAAGAIGTLTINGGLNLDKGTYQVHLGNNGVSDLIDVSGTVTIGSGANLSIQSISGINYSTGWQYTILKGASITGQFANAQNNVDIVGSFATLKAQYSATDVKLVITAADGGDPGGGDPGGGDPGGGDPGGGGSTTDFRSKAITPNQIATATALNTVSHTSAIYNAVFLSANDAATRSTLDQLSGSSHASTKSALIQDSHFVRDAINDRIRNAFSGVAAPAMPVMSYAQEASVQRGPFAAYTKAPAQAPAAFESFAVWGSAFGSWGKVDGSDNSAPIDRKTSGFLIGADAPIADSWRVGILAGYSHSNFDTANSDGSGDNYHAGAYAGTQWGALAFRSGLAYTWHTLKTKRTVQAALLGGGVFADTLSADYKAKTFQAFGEFGYRFDMFAAAFEPFVNLAHIRFTNERFTETGGPAALSVQEGTTGTTFTTLGLRAAKSFDAGDLPTVLRGSLGWRHALGDVDPRSTHAFTTGDAFTIAGAPIDHDAAVVEAGLDFRISPTAVLGVSYNGQFGTTSSENGATAHLKVNF